MSSLGFKFLLRVRYGFITSTPKEGWRYFDVVGPFRDAFPGVPIGFDTDVNASVMAEQVYHGEYVLLFRF